MFHKVVGGAAVSVEYPEYWSKEDYIKDLACPVEAGAIGPRSGTFSEKELMQFHEMYCRIIPAWGALWEEALGKYLETKTPQQIFQMGIRNRRGSKLRWVEVKDWYAVWQTFRGPDGLATMLGRAPTAVEQAMVTTGIERTCAQHKSADVGPVRFKPESWVLARPDQSKMRRGKTKEAPQFGRVKNFYNHKGPDGVHRLVARMAWHDTVPDGTELYHAEMRCPLISTEVVKDSYVMWPVQDIVPLVCMAEPDLDVPAGSPARLVMLARSWSPLKHLGFKRQWHLYPYPDLPDLVSSDTEEEEV